MEIKKILITGGTGFIGSHLANHLRKKNHIVFCTTQSPKNTSPHPIPYKLGDIFPWDQLPGVDTIIHLAWNLNEKTETNSQATIALAQQGLDRNIKQQIFFSSFSAHAKAQSHYGKTKHATEFFFLKNGLKVCRPGLVIGDGGVYLRMIETVKNYKLIPLIDGGRDLIPFIHIEKLCSLTEEFLNNNIQIGHFFEPEPKTLKSIIQDIANKYERSPKYIHVPSLWLLPIVEGLEAISIKLPITSENIYGVISNRESPHRSTLSDPHPQ